MTDAPCSHIAAITDGSTSGAPRMRRMREDRRTMGAFANLSAMRRDVVLRQFA